MAIASKPTQEFITLKEIHDGVIVMKDESLRSILMASSLNVALKSEEEQAALLLQFQNFLNSLDFPLQIFIQSRRLDIRPYIAMLENRMHEQLDDILKIQTKEYIEFIKELSETSNIMTKNFLIVVPYTVSPMGKRSMIPIPGLGGNAAQKTKNETFEENRTQLDQRAAVVAQGMSRLGIRVVQLGTEEIIELFYKLFNPGESEKPIALENKK